MDASKDACGSVLAVPEKCRWRLNLTAQVNIDSIPVPRWAPLKIAVFLNRRLDTLGREELWLYVPLCPPVDERREIVHSGHKGIGVWIVRGRLNVRSLEEYFR
jgi:hypothetical protein